MIVLAALVSAAAVGGSPAQVLPNCLGKPQVRPTQVVLACADANFYVKGIRWTGWGTAVTAGVGTAHVNDCTPNCVAGHFHTYSAVLVASGRRPCTGGTTAYGKVEVAFVGPSPFPKSSVADVTYPTRCG